MRKTRFTETQIIGILKSVEAGRLVKDVCRCQQRFKTDTVGMRTKSWTIWE